MKKIKQLILCLVGSVMLPSFASAAIITMDFEGLPIALGSNAVSTAAYTEDGLTMTPLSHFDMFTSHPSLSPGPGKNAVIHEGNNGSNVSFSFSGGASFDLLSLDVIGWFFGNSPVVNSTTLTATSSSGATLALSASVGATNFSGIWDFSGNAGFMNISGFSLSMPNPGTTCVNGNNCPNFAFDNVTIQAPPAVRPVPEPSALLLLGMGVLGLGLARHRTKA